MAISEKVELLGKGLYAELGIPDVLTVTSIPTVSELDYVSSEDFNKTMIEKILPQAVEEKIDFYNLLEIDYYWLLRCLRIINYGPYITTNAIYCDRCGRQFGEFRADLQTIGCKPIPEGFKNEIKISKDEFIEFNKDVVFKLFTIREALNAEKDEQFKDRRSGKLNRDFARMCYSIKSIGTDTGLTPVEIRLKLESQLTSPDYIILKDIMEELRDYGLRAGGSVTCPKCGNKDATFIALVDDRYFRPTLGDLRAWKADRARRQDENTAGNKTKNVREHNR